MGRFHEILEEEHRKFVESIDFDKMKSELFQHEESEYVMVKKQFLEDLKDFDYWKEWKNEN